MSIGDGIILASIAVKKIPRTVVNKVPLSLLCVLRKDGNQIQMRKGEKKKTNC